MSTVTTAHAEYVLNLVADWMGENGLKKPVPTGRDAANSAQGPVLNMEWDWPSSGPTPTVILEGFPGAYWAVECCAAVQDAIDAAGKPLFVEPYSGWALCIYPA